MLIVRFKILFWAHTIIGLHSLMWRTHRFSHIVLCCRSLSPLCLKHCVLASVSLRPSLPEYQVSFDWSADTRRARTTNYKF